MYYSLVKLPCFRCNICGKSFAVKSTLDAHTRSHSRSKKFQCSVCHSFFASKGSYSIHMRIHTGSKPLQCPYCPAKFRTSGHRRAHILGHFKTNGDSGGNPQVLGEFSNPNTATGEEEEEEVVVCGAAEDTQGDNPPLDEEASIVNLTDVVPSSSSNAVANDDISGAANSHVFANLEPINTSDGIMSFMLQMPTVSGVQNINLSSLDANNLISQWFNANDQQDLKPTIVNSSNATTSSNNNNNADTEEETANSISVNPNIVMTQAVGVCGGVGGGEVDDDDNEYITSQREVVMDGGIPFSLNIEHENSCTSGSSDDNMVLAKVGKHIKNMRGGSGAAVSNYGCSLCASNFCNIQEFQDHLLIEHGLSIKLQQQDGRQLLFRAATPEDQSAGAIVLADTVEEGHGQSVSAPVTSSPEKEDAGRESYECQECGQRFPALEAAQQHVLTHDILQHDTNKLFSKKTKAVPPKLANSGRSSKYFSQDDEAAEDNNLLSSTKVEGEDNASSPPPPPLPAVSTNCLFCSQAYPTRQDLSNHVTNNHLDQVMENSALVEKMGLVLRWKGLDVEETSSGSTFRPLLN